MAPGTVSTMDLAAAARAALGPGRRLARVERLAGGTSKGVYRLTMDDATTAIAYRWADGEDYWPAGETDGDLADPFSPGKGLDLYLAAHRRLDALGLRVPAVHLAEPAGPAHPADLVIVEDFPGPTLEERGAGERAGTLRELAESLAAMRAYRASRYGKVGFVDGGGVSHGGSCEDTALAFGLRCLTDAAGRDPRIAAHRERLHERLLELRAVVEPRAAFSVVHGELGLDHVLVDAQGRPVLIDVESLAYFDVEREHVFLRIRLGGDYPLVAADDLDPRRMALYQLVQHLSLVAGPLRLLDGDFPDRDFMLGIADWNGREALRLAGAC